MGKTGNIKLWKKLKNVKNEDEDKVLSDSSNIYIYSVLLTLAIRHILLILFVVLFSSVLYTV